ncbi:MAG: hypothetical protein ACOX0X_03435 [Candidatus Dojkabacteria bacterium]|jgi:hypothetical protein
MAIIYYKFKRPINIDNISETELETCLLFATPQNIPPGFLINITPEGCEEEHMLETKSDPYSTREDTIAKVTIVRKLGGADSSPEAREQLPVATEAEQTSFTIDASNTLLLLSRSYTLEGREENFVDGVVRYKPS